MSGAVRPLRSEQPGSARPTKHSLQVVEARRRRRRTGLVAFATLVFVFGVLFALAGFQAHLAQGQAHLDQLNRDVRAEQGYLDRLRLRVAELTAPAHIVERATKMGMVAPTGVTYLQPDGAVVVEVQANGLATGGTTDIRSVADGDAWATLKQVDRAAP